jgi:hypothetical protein
MLDLLNMYRLKIITRCMPAYRYTHLSEIHLSPSDGGGGGGGDEIRVNTPDD